MWVDKQLNFQYNIIVNQIKHANKKLAKERKNIMTKQELITNVANGAELTKKDAEKAVNAVFTAITETLSAGDKLQIVGFGTFEVRERAARKGRNPQTGAEIEIAASKAPAFKAGKALKEAVNK